MICGSTYTNDNYIGKPRLQSHWMKLNLKTPFLDVENGSVGSDAQVSDGFPGVQWTTKQKLGANMSTDSWHNSKAGECLC